MTLTSRQALSAPGLGTYCLKYQNHRSDYVAAFWTVISWAEVNRRLRGQAAPRLCQRRGILVLERDGRMIGANDAG